MSLSYQVWGSLLFPTSPRLCTDLPGLVHFAEAKWLQRRVNCETSDLLLWGE